MKKSCTAICLLFIALLSIYSEPVVPRSSEATFKIKAFKIGLDPTEGVEMVITDAVPGMGDNYNVIGDVFPLDSILNDLLDSAPDMTEEDVNHRSVFSFRVAGNIPGKFTVEITLNSLQLDLDENGTMDDSRKTDFYDIHTAYRFAYPNFTFQGANSTTITDEDGKKKYEIKEVTGESKNETGIVTCAQSETLKKVFEVTAPDGITTIPDIWIARCAVAMTISSNGKTEVLSGYADAHEGRYLSQVTVKLTKD